MNHDFEKPVLWSLELELSLKPCWSAEQGNISGTQQTHQLVSVFRQLLCTISMAPVISGYYSSVLGEVGGEELAMTGCLSSPKIPKFISPHYSVAHRWSSSLPGAPVVFCAKWHLGLLLMLASPRKRKLINKISSLTILHK